MDEKLVRELAIKYKCSHQLVALILVLKKRKVISEEDAQRVFEA